jgi:Secretion system C-terminal sorting domain
LNFWAAIIAFFLLGTVTVSVAMERPMAPVAFASADRGFELFWFYPGLHRVTLGNLKSAAQGDAFPGTADRQYAVITHFSLNPPVMVNSVSTFISHRDPFPQLPGDEHSTLSLALKRSVPPEAEANLWTGLVFLDSLTGPPGGIVSSVVQKAFTNTFDIWASLEWLAGTPCAPLVGLCPEIDTLRQFIYSLAYPEMPPEESFDDYMIGIDLLNWTENGTFAFCDDSVKPDFFRVIFISDTTKPFSTTILVDSLGLDSLHAVFQIAESGYVGITAVKEGIEWGSDFVHLDPAKLPPLLITPPKLQQSFTPGMINSYFLHLTNTGGEAYSLKLSYDSTKIILETDSIYLAAGEGKDVGLAIKDGELVDSTFAATIIMELSDSNSLPLIYHLDFQQEPPNDLADDSDPPVFYFEVGQPYPNPFNHLIRTPISLSGRQEIIFEVYNILGQKVYSVERRIGGKGNLNWDGHTLSGGKLPSGIYFFRISQNGRSVTRRVILLK